MGLIMASKNELGSIFNMQILNTQILVKIHDLNRKNVKTLQFDEFFVFQKQQILNGKTKDSKSRFTMF